MATGTQLEKSPRRHARAAAGGRANGPGCWGLAQVRWAQMAAAQRGWAVAAALLLAALIGGLAWYGLRPDWRTLYAGLDPDDARQTGQILTQAQIPFERDRGRRGHPGSGGAAGQGAAGDRGQGRRRRAAGWALRSSTSPTGWARSSTSR